MFTVTGLTPATYQIDVRHKKHAGTVQRGIIVAEASESNVRDIVVTTGAMVSGTVYGPSGKALSGSVVHMTMDALPNEYPRQYSTKTDKNGKYEFRHVKGGSYHVYATRSARADGNPFQSSFDLKNSRRKISVSDGESYRGENFNLGG